MAKISDFPKLGTDCIAEAELMQEFERKRISV